MLQTMRPATHIMRVELIKNIYTKVKIILKADFILLENYNL